MTVGEAIVICVAIIVVGFIIFATIALYYMKLFGKQPMDDKITNHKKSLKDREDKILYLAEEKKAEREAEKRKKKTIWTFEKEDTDKIKDEDVMEIYPTLPPKSKTPRKKKNCRDNC
jgi:hypothetical protein